MRKVSRQLNDSHYMPFLYFILFSLVIHFPMTLNYSDDARFKVILKNNDLFQWLHARYFTWTSRVLLEAVMVPVLHAGDWLWKWIDVLMIAVFVLALSKLFVKSRFAACNWLIILLFLLIPVRAFNSAGWAATTCNYLWPMTMGLIALLPLKKLLNGQRLPYYAYIICIPALIYAANQEQLCVALLIVFGAFIVFFAFQHRFYLFPVIQFLITMASFIFIASSPGNHARLMVQVVRSNHHFFMLSVANKLEIGAFSSTLNHFIFTFDPIFLILCILITAAVYAKNRDPFLRMISILPLFCTLAFGALRPVTKTLFPQLAHVLYDVRVIPYGYVQLENVWALKSYLPLAILGLVCLCILLSLLYLFSDLRTFLFAALVLFAGLMSRIVIGFTPSAWGSGVRAFFFMYVSLIIVILLVFQELLRLDKKHFPQNVLIFTALYTGLTVLNGYLLHG